MCCAQVGWRGDILFWHNHWLLHGGRGGACVQGATKSCSLNCLLHVLFAEASAHNADYRCVGTDLHHQCMLQPSDCLVMLQLLGCWAVQSIDRPLGNAPHSRTAHHVFSWASYCVCIQAASSEMQVDMPQFTL